jgi:hypothetical protein
MTVSVISPYATKYPFMTASFHDLITEGTMPRRQIRFRFPETMHAGAETGDGDLGRGVYPSEPRRDRLFIDFTAVLPTKTAGETP